MTNADKRYKSDIPDDAVESFVSPYKREGGSESWRIRLEKRAYTAAGEIVGYRHYEKDGTLLMETPVREGKNHGMKYYWDDDGAGPYLHLAEPYENGVLHGTARQWASDGALMGTYTLVHGTGYDLWRNFDEHGRLYIAEVHSMKDGSPHGYERWLHEGQRTLWHEVHWKNGERHGIERKWDHEGNLEPDYPIFHVNNAVVDETTYIGKQKADAELPEYRVEDDRNVRSFPEEILKAMN